MSFTSPPNVSSASKLEFRGWDAALRSLESSFFLNSKCCTREVNSNVTQRHVQAENPVFVNEVVLFLVSYLGLSSPSCTGSCQLLLTKQSTRRTPAREWMLFMVRSLSTEQHKHTDAERNFAYGGTKWFHRETPNTHLTESATSSSSSFCPFLTPLTYFVNLYTMTAGGRMALLGFYRSVKSTCYSQPIRHGPRHIGQINEASVSRWRKGVVHAWCQLVLRCRDQTSRAHPVKQKVGKML